MTCHGREGSADPVLGLVADVAPLGHVELEIHVLVRRNQLLRVDVKVLMCHVSMSLNIHRR